MFRLPKFFVFLFSLCLVAGLANGARAATQSLALLETDSPIALQCAGGVCKAELSTFCLQKERALPRKSDPYRPADAGAITLVLTGTDGVARRVSAAGHVHISAARNDHTAVTVALPRDALAALGAEGAAIEVAARAVLMPVPVAGDQNPQTEQEKALATGPLRELGEKLVDRGPHDPDRVRAVNRLINALPADIDRSPDAQARLWREAAATGFRGTSRERLATAAEEYAACWRNRIVQLRGDSVRTCLQDRHDDLMWGHVNRYWNAVGAGS